MEWQILFEDQNISLESFTKSTSYWLNSPVSRHFIDGSLRPMRRTRNNITPLPPLRSSEESLGIGPFQVYHRFEFHTRLHHRPKRCKKVDLSTSNRNSSGTSLSMDLLDNLDNKKSKNLSEPILLANRDRQQSNSRRKGMAIGTNFSIQGLCNLLRNTIREHQSKPNHLSDRCVMDRER